MDVSTLTMVTPDSIQSVGDMLQLAMLCCDKPPKALAAEIGYSVDSIYSAMKGMRNIPTQARQKLSGLNCIAAAAVALEATGFKRWFGYQKVDRHIQSMILRQKAHQKEMQKLLDELPLILLDKNSREDLTCEEAQHLTNTAHKMSDQINSSINLIMELDTKYNLRLTTYLQEKEKSPVLAHRRLLNENF